MTLRGLRNTLARKEPTRLEGLYRALDARVRGLGVRAPEAGVQLLEWLQNRASSAASAEAQAFVIVNEDTVIPKDGIDFDVPAEHVGKMTKSLLDSCRRLHVNCGHPPNAELERIIRLSGGSEQARLAVKGLRCTICQKSANTKLPRPGRIREGVGQFNETIFADLGYVKDTDGKSHAYLLIMDDGTDYGTVRYLTSKSADALYQNVEEGWIGWAGPPDVFVADGERGFAAEEFGTKMGRAGTLYIPSASYAPWQKGKIERKI